MSGKFLARASALSLAVFLAACGGDENSTPIVNVNTGQEDAADQDDGSTATPGGDDSGETTNPDGDADNTEEPETPKIFQVGSFDTSGTFQNGVIRIDTPVMVVTPTTPARTKISLSILDENGELDTTGHSVEIYSTCSSDVPGEAATIETTGATTSGNVIAYYESTLLCLSALGGQDTITAVFDGDPSLKATADISLSEYEFVLGSINGDGEFDREILNSSKTTLSYTEDDTPSAEVRAAVGMFDTDGTYVGLLKGTETNIEFYSTCTNSGLATVSSTGATTTGELISTYSAEGCAGTDTIWGRIVGTNETASTSIEITPKAEQVLLLGRFDEGAFIDREIGKSRATPLPVGAQTRLYLSLVDEADQTTRLIGQPLSIQLSSTCEGVNNSESPFAATNLSMSNGYAEVLYTAQTCGLVEEDVVTATLTGADGLSAIAQTTITLDKDGVAHSLTALQPEPNSIASGDYDGTYEGRTSTSFIQFQLKNKGGIGDSLANRTISFRLDDPAVSGITLTPTTAQTDEGGSVTVTVKAENGAPNSVFRVVASYTDVNGNLLETYSAPIAVNSKLPFAEKFSLSTSNFAPDTQPGKDGVQVQLTLLAADDQGNRIRGNTVVNFETDQGSIDPECVLDNDGRCTVTWESLGIDDTFATIRAYTHGRLADVNGLPAGTGEIQSFANMLMSSSDNVQVLLERTSPSGGNIDLESNTYCATTWVNLPGETTRFSPPSGTEILFELTEGEFINESSSNNTIPSSSSLLTIPGYTACTKVRPAETVEEIEIPDGSGGVTIVEQTTLDIELSVTVTPPADAPVPATDYIKETYQF